MAGFTKVENDVLERILTASFSKRQLKILFLIVRFSFGCQKNYALLKNKDFSYALVSPYCIKRELQKLVGKRVIKWNPEIEMVWINKNLSEWVVEKSGKRPVDKSEFIKIVTKNLPKKQIKIYQNGKLGINKMAMSSWENGGKNKENQPPKEKIKENRKREKENKILKIKILDDLARKRQNVRVAGFENLKSILKRINIPKL